MQKIKCLLIDDEPPAIQLLQNYVNQISDIEVVRSFNNAVKALEYFHKNEVDLIILDIRMPVLNGLDLIKTLRYPPATIITTAYREYAVDGYDLDIIDYLLKPITFDRFLKSVQRFRDRLQPTDYQEAHIFVNVNRTHHRIVLSKIIYIESLKDYVRVHMQEENLVVKGNIGRFLKQLPAFQFVRIHRSYAINLKYLRSFNQSVVDVNGVKLPIGNSYRDVLNT